MKTKWASFTIQKNNITEDQIERLDEELMAIAKKYECETLCNGSEVLTDIGSF